MEIVNNKATFAFEGKLEDGEVATLSYRWLKGSMVLMHTIIPAAHRGKGLGEELVKFVLQYVRDHQLKIIVYCTYVKKYMDEHPENDDLLDPDHKHS